MFGIIYRKQNYEIINIINNAQIIANGCINSITETTEFTINTDELNMLLTDQIYNIGDILDRQIELSFFKSNKVIEITKEYFEEVANGFQSSAGGILSTYAYADIDQTKFMKVLLTMASGLATYPIPIGDKNRNVILMSQQQLVQLFKDIHDFEWAEEVKYRTLISTIGNSINIDQLNNIIW